MTFSVVGHSVPGAGPPAWGVAVASKFLAVGSAVPAAGAGAGALATQADAHLGFKSTGLLLLGDGMDATDVLARLLAEDQDREHRQVGVVDRTGAAASHTGSACLDWAGGFAAPGVAVQGNVLTGPEVVRDMESAWTAAADLGLARRLLATLAAGDAAGGDRRGRQSAALLVVCEGAGYGGHDDVAVDLRVDDHPDPVAELDRLLGLHELYLTASTEEEKVKVTPELATELEDRAAALGHADFASWVGTENYEMRVDADRRTPAWVDRAVLEIIRRSPASPVLPADPAGAARSEPPAPPTS